MNRITSTTSLLLCTALISASAVAQPGPGPGMGGPGAGGWQGWKWNSGNVAGWQLMTPEERTEHQNKMRSMKTYEECTAYQQEHRKLMEQRAKEKGATLPTPRMNACDRMKARGLIK